MSALPPSTCVAPPARDRDETLRWRVGHEPLWLSLPKPARLENAKRELPGKQRESVTEIATRVALLLQRTSPQTVRDHPPRVGSPYLPPGPSAPASWSLSFVEPHRSRGVEQY